VCVGGDGEMVKGLIPDGSRRMPDNTRRVRKTAATSKAVAGIGRQEGSMRGQSRFQVSGFGASGKAAAVSKSIWPLEPCIVTDNQQL